MAGWVAGWLGWLAVRARRENFCAQQRASWRPLSAQFYCEQSLQGRIGLFCRTLTSHITVVALFRRPSRAKTPPIVRYSARKHQIVQQSCGTRSVTTGAILNATLMGESRKKERRPLLCVQANLFAGCLRHLRPQQFCVQTQCPRIGRAHALAAICFIKLVLGRV